MKFKYLILFASIFFCWSTVSAERTTKQIYFDCSDLIPCEEPVCSVAKGRCLSYLDGLFDMYVLLNDGFELQMSCPPPKGITLEQLRLVFIQYVKENPKVMEESARLTLIKMLKYYYPCSEEH